MRINLKRSILRSFASMLRPVYSLNDMDFIFYLYKANVTVGARSYGRIHVYSYQTNCSISIGKYTSISEINVVLGGNHHRDTSIFPFRARLLGQSVVDDNERAQGISIGSDCWIGVNATILDGVNIATGSIIGAGSVVAKSTTPYSISVGNPAKEVSRRFDPEGIDILLQSKWWDYPESKLILLESALYSKDPNALIKELVSA